MKKVNVETVKELYFNTKLEEKVTFKDVLSAHFFGKKKDKKGNVKWNLVFLSLNKETLSKKDMYHIFNRLKRYEKKDSFPITEEKSCTYWDSVPVDILSDIKNRLFEPEMVLDSKTDLSAIM